MVRVNALQRATLISTTVSEMLLNLYEDVSMPSNGQHSFLRHCREHRSYRSRCQCPPTGNTHFYAISKAEKRAATRVAMPSNGPHSFLQTQAAECLRKTVRVNALKRATLISTLEMGESCCRIQGRVNALKRAALISTRCSIV